MLTPERGLCSHNCQRIGAQAVQRRVPQKRELGGGGASSTALTSFYWKTSHVNRRVSISSARCAPIASLLDAAFDGADEAVVHRESSFPYSSPAPLCFTDKYVHL